MNAFFQDLRYGFRTILRNPGFAAIAILTLGLGIGVNTAVFSFVDALILRPLPVHKPSQIVSIDTRTSKSEQIGSSSYPEYVDIRDHNRTLSGILASTFVQVGMSDATPSSHSELVFGEMVTGNFFSVLGVRPALGRDFRPDEDRIPNAAPVAIISNALWKRRFASDPNISGRQVKLNGFTFTIIGVAPASFTGDVVVYHPDVYVPVMMKEQVQPGVADWLHRYEMRTFSLLGRLKDGVSYHQASTDLNIIMSSIAREHPDTNKDAVVSVLPQVEQRMQVRILKVFTFLLGLVVLVLLIACANVANLLLARASGRSREIAVRLALGAGRGRLIRQLITESSLLALLGGGLGLLLGSWCIQLLANIRLGIDEPFSIEMQLDSRVLLYTLILAVGTLMLFGLAPAIRTTHVSLISALKDSVADARGRLRWWSGRNLLVTGQVALSLVLLVSASLFLRAFVKAASAAPGFDTNNMLLMTVNLGTHGYGKQNGDPFYRDLLEKVRAIPGVRSAALAESIPFYSCCSNWQVSVDGYTPPGGQRLLDVENSVITPGYFETMRIPIRQGRDFTERDGTDARWNWIINETMARTYWPGVADVTGRHIHHVDGSMATVIGVVADSQLKAPGLPPAPHFFVPLHEAFYPIMALHVRTKGDPMSYVASVRREIQSLDPEIAPFDVMTMNRAFSQSGLLGERLTSIMSGTFGLLALILTVVGLYGVTSYTVARRTREIGIRMALGAERFDVLRMVALQALAVVLLGAAIGLGGAFASTRVLAGIVSSLPSHDPAPFVLVPLLLCAIAISATLVPARRATKIAPTVALRYE